jgi:anhydro-N-acetylmuramic acid kinase
MDDLLTRARRGETLRALGLMSGTSLDGVDVAMIETDGERIVGLGAALTVPYSDTIRDAVRAVFGAEAPSRDTALAEQLVTQAHGEAVETFLDGGFGCSVADIDVVGFHGQTIAHRPERHFTWQIGDAPALAQRLGLPVVADFRSRDVAAGGQGAPLVPIYHQALVRQAAEEGRIRLPVAVLNIGGVANVTWIGQDSTLLAFDTGPGNAPLDDWIRRHGAGTCDEDGRVSARGTVVQSEISTFLNSSYFKRKPPKSLDRNDFIDIFSYNFSLEDGAATLAFACASAAAVAVDHMPAPPTAWLVCGGGVRNHSIISMLQDISHIKVDLESMDWADGALEAQAFGFLAVRSLRGLPLSFPTTTAVPTAQPGGRLFLP